jgi:prepilin-type N-terminal cleavage/methylation domain-containing protein
MITRSRRKQDEGFSLIEVLVAMMMTSLFLNASLQMMLAANMIRIRANQRYGATETIRKDLQEIWLIAKDTTNPNFDDLVCGEYGEALKNVVEEQPFDGVIEDYEGKDINVTRTLTSNGDTLDLNYKAELADPNLSPEIKKLAEYDTKILPDAALECKQN